MSDNSSNTAATPAAATATPADECPICFDSITTATGHATLGCSHRFHLMCIVRWFQDQEAASSCPCCRHEVGRLDNVPLEPETAEEGDGNSDDDDDDGEWLDEEDDEDDDADSVGSLRRVWSRDPVGGQWEGQWVLHHPVLTIWDPVEDPEVPEELTDIATQIQRIWRGHRVRRGPLSLPAAPVPIQPALGPEEIAAITGLLMLSRQNEAAQNSWIMQRMLRVD